MTAKGHGGLVAPARTKTLEYEGLRWKQINPHFSFQLIEGESAELFVFQDALRHWLLVKRTMKGRDSYVKLELKQGNDFVVGSLESSFDPISKKYLWYIFDRGFADGEKWRVQAWWFDPNTNALAELEIPKGPWSHSFLDELSCLSCGCSCYSRYEMYGFNDRVLIKVSGKAFSSSESGLFLLTKGGWEKIAGLPEAELFLLSPKGCDIAFLSQGLSRARYFSVCDF